MRFRLNYGKAETAFDVDEAHVVGSFVGPPAGIADPAAAVRAALATPFGFPPLRRALTPDDHVALVIDDRLPCFLDLLVPVLEHLQAAGVAPAAVTLVSAPGTGSQSWLESIPEPFEDIHIEVHDPADRRKQSYLATTKHGRRLYLNRTVVDADQIVVLSGRRYDPILGYGGGEGALFPFLCDNATRHDLAGRIRFEAPTPEPWPACKEAIESAWLLGAPFFVQVIEAASDGIDSVVAGSVEASAEGRRLQDARWRVGIPREVDVVVAAVSGDPVRHTFADLAAALACASRVIRPEGRIVLLSEALPELGTGAEVLLNSDNPTLALKKLQEQPDLEHVAAIQWAQAASHARINLLSGLPAETAENLFTTPIEKTAQIKRLLEAAGDIVFLADAHKALAEVEDDPLAA